jgi:hypothetical protein
MKEPAVSAKRSSNGSGILPLPLTNSDWSLTGCAGPFTGISVQDSYLVDSASSHMLVSKIKPCMSKYKQLYGETANGSLNQLSFI